MKSYRIPSRSKSCSVWFKTLAADGRVLKDYPGAACFAPISSTLQYSGYGMHPDTKIINVYRNKSMIPYDLSEIKRWIADLNELGFPCELIEGPIIGDPEKQEDYINKTCLNNMSNLGLKIIRDGHIIPVDENSDYNFYVRLDNFNNKNHLFSTLSLIRMLSESYLDTVPEEYFNTMDLNPNADKFVALQNAHRESSVSAGHSVTYSRNGNNISHKKLMERLHTPSNFWEDPLTIHAAWRD